MHEHECTYVYTMSVAVHLWHVGMYHAHLHCSQPAWHTIKAEVSSKPQNTRKPNIRFGQVCDTCTNQIANLFA
jgi:hypothetical protein